MSERAMFRTGATGCWVALALSACSSAEPPVEGAASGAGAEVADAVLLSGDASAVQLVPLYESADGRFEVTDLAFNPSYPGEAWAVLRQSAYAGEPCLRQEPPGTPENAAACSLLAGSVAIIEQATSESPSVTVRQDANAWHFMRLPMGIAFGPSDTFATCGEARTGNFDNDEADFMGPTLWSADPSVFGPDGPGGNGSHLDMLHATPLCMGIAHERDNVYWAVNGQVGAVDRYDFEQPHEPGGADHSDGAAARYLTGELERVAGVPSHAILHDGWLYVSDTGGGRVVRFDISSGATDGAEQNDDDQLGYRMDRVVDVRMEEFVAPGVLERPSGIAVSDGIWYVTDNATGLVTAFDGRGAQLQSLDVGAAPGALAGIAIGPDTRAYLALLSGAVVRVDAR